MTASPIQLLMHAIPVFTAVTIVPATPGLSEKYDCRIWNICCGKKAAAEPDLLRHNACGYGGGIPF